MPQQAWNKKRERQYEHIKDSLEDRGRSEDTAEQIADRTVNKERARSGEAKQKIVREITYRDWRILGAVAEHDPVEIVINDNGRIIFGRCTCPHFAEHLLNQGPCEHMLALFKVSEDMRADRPSSAPAAAQPQTTTRRVPSRWEVDDAEAGASQ